MDALPDYHRSSHGGSRGAHPYFPSKSGGPSWHRSGGAKVCRSGQCHGSIAGQVAAKVQIRIKAEYDGTAFSCYSVYEGTSRHTFEKYAPAEAFALEAARRAVKEKAIRQGSSENPRIQVEVKKIRSESALASIFFESIVEASAYDEFQA